MEDPPALEVVVGVPVTERGVLRLSRLLWGLASSYYSIALPLPSSLCIEAVTAPSKILEIAYKYMGRAHVRVWSSLLIELPKLAETLSDITIRCYLPDNFYESAEELGYKLVALVVKARVFGKVDVEEWLELFKPPSKSRINVDNVKALVTDGYSWTIRAYREYNAKKLMAVERLIPTPLDLLELIAHKYLGSLNVEDVIRYAIKYIREYIVRSRDLTEAYDKLSRDKGYMELLGKLKVKILERNLEQT